jgi:hypothetical protein
MNIFKYYLRFNEIGELQLIERKKKEEEERWLKEAAEKKKKKRERRDSTIGELNKVVFESLDSASPINFN